jgi:hypothetical protein
VETSRSRSTINRSLLLNRLALSMTISRTA